MRTGFVAGIYGLVTLTLAGCTSTPAPTPQDMARTATQTAPADLQLICASAVATSAGLDGNSVLPIGSSQLDAARYHVELNAKGERYTCIVDNAGSVSSVQKAQA